eukprot:jgi/Mesvir1/6849/Mv09022-RA.1
MRGSLGQHCLAWRLLAIVLGAAALAAGDDVGLYSQVPTTKADVKRLVEDKGVAGLTNSIFTALQQDIAVTNERDEPETVKGGRTPWKSVDCLKTRPYVERPDIALALLRPKSALTTESALKNGLGHVGFTKMEILALMDGLFEGRSAWDHTPQSMQAWSSKLFADNHFVIYSARRLHDGDAWLRLVETSNAQLVAFLRNEDIPLVLPDWLASATALFDALPKLSILGGHTGWLANGDAYGANGGSIPTLEPHTRKPFLYVSRVSFGPIVVRRSHFIQLMNMHRHELACDDHATGDVFFEQLFKMVWAAGFEVGLFDGVIAHHCKVLPRPCHGSPAAHAVNSAVQSVQASVAVMDAEQAEPARVPATEDSLRGRLRVGRKPLAFLTEDRSDAFTAGIPADRSMLVFPVRAGQGGGWGWGGSGNGNGGNASEDVGRGKAQGGAFFASMDTHAGDPSEAHENASSEDNQGGAWAGQGGEGVAGGHRLRWRRRRLASAVNPLATIAIPLVVRPSTGPVLTGSRRSSPMEPPVVMTPINPPRRPAPAATVVTDVPNRPHAAPARGADNAAGRMRVVDRSGARGAEGGGARTAATPAEGVSLGPAKGAPIKKGEYSMLHMLVEGANRALLARSDHGNGVTTPLAGPWLCCVSSAMPPLISLPAPRPGDPPCGVFPSARREGAASVVMQYFHRPDNVERILTQLHQSSAEAEIIVMDDSSSDHAVFYRTIAKLSGGKEAAVGPKGGAATGTAIGGSKPANVFLVLSHNLHEIRAYNRGVKLASQEVVAIIQDDDSPPATPRWLLSAASLFDQFPKMGMIGGHAGRMDFPGDMDWTGRIQGPKYGPGFLQIDHVSATGNIPFMFVYKVNAAPLLLRRKLFLELGMFNTKLSCPGESGIGFDYEYSIRLWYNGYQVSRPSGTGGMNGLLGEGPEGWCVFHAHWGGSPMHMGGARPLFFLSSALPGKALCHHIMAPPCFMFPVPRSCLPPTHPPLAICLSSQ